MTVTAERPESLVQQLVPGASVRRRLLVLGALAVAIFTLLIAPSDTFRDGFHDWRYLEDLQADVRPLDVGQRAQAATVALGDGRVLVWGGRGQGPASGIVLNPTSGDVEPLPEAPGPGRFSAAAVWTGTEALVWGGSTSSSPFVFDPGGVAFDPATGTWRELAPAPIGLVGARAAALDGGVLFAGGAPQSSDTQPVSLWLDAATGAWTRIDAPVQVVSTVRLGDRLLATGPAAPAETGSWPVWAFDPATLTWSPFADALSTQWAALAVGNDGALTAVALESLNEPLRAYAWTDGRWDEVARSARAAQGIVTIEYRGYPPVEVRTDDLLVVGGEGSLTGWDPDRRVFSHLADPDVTTFGGTAVWTGRAIAAPVNQARSGWVLEIG